VEGPFLSFFVCLLSSVLVFLGEPSRFEDFESTSSRGASAAEFALRPVEESRIVRTNGDLMAKGLPSSVWGHDLTASCVIEDSDIASESVESTVFSIESELLGLVIVPVLSIRGL
jgi:hypothetical protein